MSFVVETWKARGTVVAMLQLLGCALLIGPDKAFTQDQCEGIVAAAPAPTLVLGFVGGFVHSDDTRHSEVQLARRLQSAYGESVQVRIFKNRDRAKAHTAIVEWLNGVRTTDNPLEPRVILFGHSWGASAVVYLARELEHDGVPVALTVQVDSIQKHGHDDSVIPPNVAEAVNFYQSKGILQGRSRILAANPARTVILGNFYFKYEKEPGECRIYPWYDRLFFKGHTSIECDPRVWSDIQSLIETRLGRPFGPGTTDIAAGVRE